MTDLLRPVPARSRRQRLVAVASSIGPARLAASAGTVLLVAVTGWWLLRAPAPPIDAGLPRTKSSTSASSRTATSARSAAGARTASSSPNQGSTTTATSSATTSSASTVTTIVVQVVGAVVHPGVYRLADGARVVDLIGAAGGPDPGADAAAVAQAERLVDGERVVVPRVGETIPPSPPPAPASKGASGASAASAASSARHVEPIDINAATLDQLDQLPGVGPATAAAIIAYRERHGRFASVDELADVHGVGPAKLDVIRPLVRV